MQKLARFCVLTLLLSLVSAAADPTSTALTYQGRLFDTGARANGTYDFVFTLFDAPTNGTAVSSSLTCTNITLTNGLFTVALNFDPATFAGDQRWLEVGIRTSGSNGDFQTLAPRQEVTPQPYALYSLNAASATTAATATALGPGALSGALALTNPANRFAGSFTGDGSGLSNIVFYLNAKKDFGAVGDGNTDDTAALQAGLSALTNSSSTTLRIPTGIYRITDTLDIPYVPVGWGYSPGKGRLTIVGSGWGATTIVCDLGNKPAMSFASENSPSMGINFQDFGLIGPLVNDLSTEGAGPAIIGGIADVDSSGGFGGAYVDFRNLLIAGFSSAVSLSNVWAPTFTHCILSSNRLAGIELTDCHYALVTGCEIFGVPGVETGKGVAFYPAGGVQGTIMNTSFTCCTNALYNMDVSLTVIGSEFQNNGTAVTALNGFPVHLLGCGFSELFGQTAIFTVTNGFPGIIEADGTSAHALTIDSPVFEIDSATPNRVQISTFGVDQNAFDFNGLSWYMPRLVNYPGPYLRGLWNGTNAYNVYPFKTTSPVFNAQVTITNQPPMNSGAPHGLVLVDGNENGGLFLGGDGNQGSALTPGVDKLASIVGPSLYTGLFDTTLLSWGEVAPNSGFGGVLGLGGSVYFTDPNRNSPIYIDFFTKPSSLPPNPGTLRWRIDDSGTLSSQNGSGLDLGAGSLTVDGSNGLTTDIDVVTPTGNSKLRFKKGILIEVIPQ